MSATPRAEVVSPRSTRLSAWLDREDVLGYLMVTPVVILVIGFLAYPFYLALSTSLTDKVIGGEPHFIGLQNYVALWNDSIYQQAIRNTIVFTVGSIVIKLPLGFILALVLNEKIKLRKAFRSAVLLPWIVPAVLSAMAWLWMFNGNFSVLNYIIVHLGLGRGVRWVSDPNMAMFSVTLVNAWRGIPFYGITLLAGMQAIPTELYEATAIDGAGPWARFRHVAFPLVLPILVITLLLSTISTVSDFNVIYSLTGGGPFNSTQVLAVYSYATALGSGKMGEGAAVSLTMFPLLLALLVLEVRYLTRRSA